MRLPTNLLTSLKTIMKRHRKISTVAVILVVVAVYGVYKTNQQSGATAARSVAQAKAIRGSIEVTVTGTATIVPLEAEEIGPNVSGTVEKIYVQNGDQVKKGDLLAEVVNDTLIIQVANARLELETAALNLKDSSVQLSSDTITAPFSGRVVSLNVQKGDEVSRNSVLATLQNDSQLVFDMAVDSATAQKASIGQSVEVFLPDRDETLKGKVISKNSQGISGYNGENRTYLQVAIAAVGVLSSDMKAFGTITIGGKQVDALSVSTLRWMDETQLKATLTGEVSGLYVKEGQTVKKGQKLFALNSDSAEGQKKTLQVAYEQAKLNLSDLEGQLADLQVKAPIDGIISGVDVKAGDDLGSAGSGSTNKSETTEISSTTSTSTSATLGKIINTGQMKVSFPVDEVDIAKVKVGQPATIDADALPDKKFEGKVIEIADEGVVTNNVSSFEVTILIDNPKGLLKSGMTANVTIMTAQKDNVVLIPIEALQERGQRKFVMIPGGENAEQESNMKPVTVGLTNESYAEITEGLQEGEEILLPGQLANTNTPNSMIPGFGGGNRIGGGNRPPSDGPARSGGGGTPR